MNPFSVGMFDT